MRIMTEQQQHTIVDGVHRMPNNGIKIIVVGGGNGGLAGALECWRKGCEVVVLERSPALSPLGDFFTITPSGLTTLKDYPSMHPDYHRNIYDCTIHVYIPSGMAIKSTVPEWNLPGVNHSAPDVKIEFLKRRADFAEMQYEQLKRLGVPVYFGQKAMKVQESQDEVTVTTTDGQSFTGDLCIGSMGIGNDVAGFNTGPKEAVQDSGYAIARTCFAIDPIKSGSLAAELLHSAKGPQFRTYIADDLHLILFLTSDYAGWALTHQNDGTSAESWGNLRSVEDMLPYLEKGSAGGWDPAVIDFVKQTPNEVVDWNLRWRDYTEQWTSTGGRLLRPGDSAHAFSPTAGNGAVQALEDAVFNAECLRIGGKDNIQWATKVHNKLNSNGHPRFQRVAVLQRTGFINREELHATDVDVDVIEAHPEDANIGFFKLGRWMWGHNPEHYARDNYEVCLAALKDGHEFKNTNLPPGHVFEPWNLALEKERMAKGTPSGLKSNGD